MSGKGTVRALRVGLVAWTLFAVLYLAAFATSPDRLFVGFTATFIVYMLYAAVVAVLRLLARWQ